MEQLNTFPYELDIDSIRNIQFQLFNNEKGHALKIRVYGTETRKKINQVYMVDLTGRPNPSSIERMKYRYRKYQHIKALEDHLTTLQDNSNETTCYGQCRKFGGRNTYYKFFDVSMTENESIVCLKLVIHNRVLELNFNKRALEVESRSSVIHLDVQGYELEDDVLSFDCEVLERTPKENITTHEEANGEVLDIRTGEAYQPTPIDVGKMVDHKNLTNLTTQMKPIIDKNFNTLSVIPLSENTKTRPAMNKYLMELTKKISIEYNTVDTEVVLEVMMDKVSEANNIFQKRMANTF